MPPADLPSTGRAALNITGEFVWHLGNNDHAKLTFSESRNAYSLDTVLVPAKFRSQGIGTELIKRLLILADGQQKDVFLSARPIGSSSEDQLARLVSYYEGFGFSTIDKGFSVVYMKRPAIAPATATPAITA